MDPADLRWLSFDVVGTLIDFETGILTCVRALRTDLDDRRVLEAFAGAEDHQQQLTPRLPFTQMLEPIYHRMAAERGVPPGRAPELRDSIPSRPAFPDAIPALAELGARYRLVALTNADGWALDRMAATLGHPFHDAVTAEDVGANKPDPQVFAYCAGRQSAFGFDRAGWMHVAQSQYHDIATATCWVERRRGREGFGATPSPDVVVPPDLHVASLAELAAAIAGVGPRGAAGERAGPGPRPRMVATPDPCFALAGRS